MFDKVLKPINTSYPTKIKTFDVTKVYQTCTIEEETGSFFKTGLKKDPIMQLMKEEGLIPSHPKL